jgi:hypothetical protein
VKGSYRLAAAAVVAAFVVLLPAVGGAAPGSVAFQVAGTEIGFTSTEGTFVGTAGGNAGDGGSWKAVVDHTELSSLPAAITGGTFAMKTIGPGLSTDVVQGVFDGGSISLVDAGLGCHNQKYDVDGTLAGIQTKTSSGGTGEFHVLLTHYRVSVLGRCVTYSASVAGTATFSY